jgi:hypothetical protein
LRVAVAYFVVRSAQQAIARVLVDNVQESVPDCDRRLRLDYHERLINQVAKQL